MKEVVLRGARLAGDGIHVGAEDDGGMGIERREEVPTRGGADRLLQDVVAAAAEEPDEKIGERPFAPGDRRDVHQGFDQLQNVHRPARLSGRRVALRPLLLPPAEVVQDP